MHKTNTLWRAVVFAASVLVFLFLLSALVEAPVSPRHIVSVDSACADRLLPVAPIVPDPAREALSLRLAIPFCMIPLCALLLIAPIRLPNRDANGRVLHKKRYARSFYLVFRKDFACG